MPQIWWVCQHMSSAKCKVARNKSAGLASLLLASQRRIRNEFSDDLTRILSGQHYASGHLGPKTDGVAACACTERPQNFFCSGHRATPDRRGCGFWILKRDCPDRPSVRFARLKGLGCPVLCAARIFEQSPASVR